MKIKYIMMDYKSFEQSAVPALGHLFVLRYSYQYRIIRKKGSLAEVTTRWQFLSLVATLCTTCYHLLSFVVHSVTHCHSLLFVITRCSTRYHLLSLDATHSLSLDLTLVCLFINYCFFKETVILNFFFKTWNSFTFLY